jgi:hypothetical protein
MMLRSPINPSFAAALIFAGATQGAYSQGNFQNLDFESANIPTATPAGSLVHSTSALPGWTVYVGNNQQSMVLYNSLYTGTAVVSLQGPGSSFGPVIQGNYMAALQAGVGGSAAISQTGTIPASAATLLFTASQPAQGGWDVTWAGQSLPVVPIATASPSYEAYGVNVSSLAGQTAALQFTALNLNGFMKLDDIQFSPNPIPEPQTWALMFCGAAGWLLIRRRK